MSERTAGRLRPAALVLGVILTVAAAAWIRAGAVARLPPDYDELGYLPAAYRYAERMQPGRWSQIPEVRENKEHPPLVKLAYGSSVQPLAGGRGRVAACP